MVHIHCGIVSISICNVTRFISLFTVCINFINLPHDDDWRVRPLRKAFSLTVLPVFNNAVDSSYSSVSGFWNLLICFSAWCMPTIWPFNRHLNIFSLTTRCVFRPGDATYCIIWVKITCCQLKHNPPCINYPIYLFP